eukprot:5851508-Amphidinium_carterae.1
MPLILGASPKAYMWLSGSKVAQSRIQFGRVGKLPTKFTSPPQEAEMQRSKPTVRHLKRNLRQKLSRDGGCQISIDSRKLGWSTDEHHASPNCYQIDVPKGQ